MQLWWMWRFHEVKWSTSGCELDVFQPWAQIKPLFEESELVSGNRKAIRKFPGKYIVPKKLVTENVEHLAQI